MIRLLLKAVGLNMLQIFQLVSLLLFFVVPVYLCVHLFVLISQLTLRC